MTEEQLPKNMKVFFRGSIILSILEGFIFAGTILAYPGDPKNAFLFGFSLSRLLLVGLILLIQGFLVFSLFNRRLNHRLSSKLISSSSTLKFVKEALFIAILLLWITIWSPPGRLGKLEASYIRFRPFLIWIELIGVQTYFLIKILNREIHTGNLFSFLKTHKKSFLLAGIFLISIAVIFFLLKRYAPIPEGLQYYIPPGAPLAGLQVFLSWAVFLLLFSVEYKASNWSRKKGWVWGIFFIIWIISFILWTTTPTSCTDDRLGPFPPNGACYPQINDAVYSIGSHYITLGQGIYHHWMTDKPFYMIFLAIGQWISGPSMDQYIAFQVFILALIPALLFLIGKKFGGLSGGLFLATLATLLELNSLRLYSITGSVNTKIENPEILTSLVLILLFFGMFNWLRHPEIKIWAVMTGGLLGLSVLIRFNPLFIVPVIILLFIWLNRKKQKTILVGLSLFVLTFSLVFLPWFFTARDSQGNNFYFMKIQDVLNSRFTPSTSALENKIEILPDRLLKPLVTSEPPMEGTTSVFQGKVEEVTKGGYTSIVYHFFNNAFTSLSKLPTEVLFSSIYDQVSGPIRDFLTYTPLWNKTLTRQNVISLFVNLLFITLGLVSAIKRHGIAGLTGAIIQIGYFLGNAASQTSGGRYLEPVIWVTLLYYALGIVACTGFFARLIHKNGGSLEPEAPEVEQSSESSIAKGTRKSFITSLLTLIGFLLLGLSVPIFNNLPSHMPEETTPQITQSVYSRIFDLGMVTPKQWQSFNSSPGSMVVQGAAYHPRYYRSDAFPMDSESFEMMLLTKQRVIISYMLGVIPENYYSDGSKTILVGCMLGNDSMWAAERTFIRTYAIIQLDHEESVYFSPNFQWVCE